MEELPLFTIRQVIELTGITEFTLRGWESRYNALVPIRTKSGRRLYTREDLVKLKLLKDLISQGFRISTIADLGIEELQTLINSNDLISSTNPKDKDVQKILELAEKFEWERIKNTILSKRKNLDNKIFITKFLISLIQEINTLVAIDRFSIAQEHILSSIIKENLYFLRMDSRPSKKKKAQIVFTTPEGDLHDIGLLMSATLASLTGIPNIYIGPNTPKVQICDIAIRSNATHLVLSSTVTKAEGAHDDFMTLINFLDRQLPKDVTFLIGGRNAMSHSFELERPYKIISTIEQVSTFFETF